ncbi:MULTISPECIES: hypothetical protein [Vibrio]|uniref:hypothetical protein n=1 Tax=Vibrio TaxID=662 RepID=UPI000F486FF2|nr:MULTISPECIES: hypothetical protein [Vibrio]MCG9559168.1 hypothetical protein [Vibrio kanaloae]ROP23245.1 hypothetical protein EDB33_103351 [Vibrio crassostreae]ROP23883.1 hypothetical protein EDB34_103351 [Vibrio crassostreae]RPE98533.1 hypothetical protein EDB15_10315 [Vibrio crassostreae]TCV11351.1 hypothetical protein EDB16_108234 [Vibrio crassostreae]
MEKKLEEALRNIWHVTSLEMGQNILKYQSIWGTDPDGAANFHPNQVSSNIPDQDSEISIGFRWEGEIKLLDLNDCELTGLKSGVMYVVLTEGFHNPTFDTVKVWTCKIPRGTDSHLSCIDVVPFTDMLDDRNFKKQFSKFQTECLKTFPVKVPSSQEISQIVKAITESPKKSLLQRLFG